MHSSKVEKNLDTHVGGEQASSITLITGFKGDQNLNKPKKGRINMKKVLAGDRT